MTQEILVSGVALGDPIPVSMSSSGNLLPGRQIKKSALISNSAWILQLAIVNRCEEGIFQPLVGVITHHAEAGWNLQIKWDLFVDQDHFLADDPFGESVMQTIAGDGWKLSYMGESTPSGLPRQGSSSRLEGIGWSHARIYYAWTANGHTAPVDVWFTPNFGIEIYTP
jgi:hypothetical protein